MHPLLVSSEWVSNGSTDDGEFAETLDGPLELGENMLSSGAERRASLRGSGGESSKQERGQRVVRERRSTMGITSSTSDVSGAAGTEREGGGASLAPPH